MSVYEIHQPADLLRGNRYPGRGIILGQSADGKYAVAAYFIMGRSRNSRNRVFTLRDGALYTEPFDPRLVEDPSLIIYAAVRKLGDRLIVTNGDQTDTIYAGLEQGKSFREALASRCFEPDAPNFTPRISGLVTYADDGFRYEMSILKSEDADGSRCQRFTYDYDPLPGLGHFLHTYVCDGDPLPSFQGEPERVRISGGPDAFTAALWDALDADNRISLYVRYTELSSGAVQERVVNRNQGGQV